MKRRWDTHQFKQKNSWPCSRLQIYFLHKWKAGWTRSEVADLWLLPVAACYLHASFTAQCSTPVGPVSWRGCSFSAGCRDLCLCVQGGKQTKWRNEEIDGAALSCAVWVEEWNLLLARGGRAVPAWWREVTIHSSLWMVKLKVILFFVCSSVSLW